MCMRQARSPYIVGSPAGLSADPLPKVCLVSLGNGYHLGCCPAVVKMSQCVVHKLISMVLDGPHPALQTMMQQ